MSINMMSMEMYFHAHHKLEEKEMEEAVCKALFSEIRRLAVAIQSEPEEYDKTSQWLTELLSLNRAIEQNYEFENSEDEKWIKVATGNLPPRGVSVLFCTKTGNVFEGHLETKDVTKMYTNEDGKISMPEHEEGGQWYRYRFCDFISMRCVVAWRMKPEPLLED